MRKRVSSTLTVYPLKALLDLKFRAEKDRGLTDGASRAFALIVSSQYGHHFANEAFEFTWKRLHNLTGWCRSRCDRRLAELVQRSYLRYGGLKGSPPARLFRFVLAGGSINCSTNESINCSTNESINCSTNETDATASEAIDCFTTESHQECNVFQTETLNKSGAGAAPAAIAAAPAKTRKEKEPNLEMLELSRKFRESL